jgi:uncharacterized protein (TIGR02996 family)
VADAEERGFLAALKQDAKDVTSRLAYADWLEEHDRPYEAMLQRVKAGVSETRFKVRRKSDGLFFDGKGGWSAKGKDWKQLGHVRAHFTQESFAPRYYGTSWDDLEVVVFEVRVRPVINLTVTQQPKERYGRVVTVHEPKGGS